MRTSLPEPLAGESDRPDARTLQRVERPRDVDDVGDPHVRHGAGRRLRGRAVEPRRVARLTDDAVSARRIDRAQDRADIVGILDLIEHDEERRAARPGDQILDAERRLIAHVGDDALVAAAVRESIQLIDIRAAHRNALRGGEADDLGEAIVGARRDTDRGDATRAQRFENRIDAVDPHSGSKLHLLVDLQGIESAAVQFSRRGADDGIGQLSCRCRVPRQECTNRDGVRARHERRRQGERPVGVFDERAIGCDIPVLSKNHCTGARCIQHEDIDDDGIASCRTDGEEPSVGPDHD